MDGTRRGDTVGAQTCNVLETFLFFPTWQLTIRSCRGIGSVSEVKTQTQLANAPPLFHTLSYKEGCVCVCVCLN